jgi:hypothetical protein
MPARVLLPLPAQDFDPSEAAVSWRVLARAGHTVSFATPDGQPAVADDIMLTGKGLDPWGGVPLLRNFPLAGLLLRANGDARAAYAEMIADPNYTAPGLPSIPLRSMRCCCRADTGHAACAPTWKVKSCNAMSRIFLTKANP